MVTIAVDVMSGDLGPSVATVPACIHLLKDYSDVKLKLVGDEAIILEHLGDSYSLYSDRIEIIHSTQVVEMDDVPQMALRKKKDSSMRVAINLVKSKDADVAVSCGNTGALMATAKFVLNTMKGIDRPAIAKLMPTIGIGDCCMLDLGANLEASPKQLYQFAILGSQYMRGYTGNQKPSVGLLNIGSEDMKGNENLKATAALLRKSKLNFYGNVEGNDISKGTVDVIVTDGFTGNVSLKSIEGSVKLVSHFLKTEFNRSFTTKLLSRIGLIPMMPILKKIRESLNPNKYNGAILLGLNGLVVKSHGGADANGFYFALKQAKTDAESGVIGLVDNYLANSEL